MSDLAHFQQNYHKQIRRSVVNEQKTKQRKVLQQKLCQSLLKTHLQNLNEVSMQSLIVYLKEWQCSNLIVDHYTSDLVIKFIYSLQYVPYQFIILLFEHINPQSQISLLASGLNLFIKVNQFYKFATSPKQATTLLKYIRQIKKPNQQILNCLFEQNNLQYLLQQTFYSIRDQFLKTLNVLFTRRIQIFETDSKQLLLSFKNCLKYLVFCLENNIKIQEVCQIILIILKRNKVQIFRQLKNQQLIDKILDNFSSTNQEQLTILNQVMMGIYSIFMHGSLNKQDKLYLIQKYCSKIILYQISITENYSLNPRIRVNIYAYFNNILLYPQFKAHLIQYPIIEWISKNIKTQSSISKQCLIKLLQSFYILSHQIQVNEPKFQKIVIQHQLIQTLIQISFNTNYNSMLALNCLKNINILIENKSLLKRLKSLNNIQKYIMSIGEDHASEQIQSELQQILFEMDKIEMEEESMNK